MTTDSCKAVLVGCGSMANGWVKMILDMPAVVLAGLVDLRRPAAEAMAERHNLSKSIVFDSLSQALAATGAGIVFDVTVPEAHEQVVTEALRAGCHVLGEKPMTVSLAQAQQMVQTAAKCSRTYAVTQNYRYNPQIRGFRQFLGSAAVGSVEELHADFYLGPRFGGFRDQMDHPLILDMSIHTFDAARFISGADPVSVYCHTFNPRRSWYRGDASAVCIFEMSGGLVFSYRGSWCADGLGTPWNSQWRAVCSQGTATWDGDKTLKAQSLEMIDKDGVKTRQLRDHAIDVPEMPHTGHTAILHDFLAAVKEGRPPETVCADNIRSLAMVLAAVESARSGQRVKVQW